MRRKVVWGWGGLVGFREVIVWYRVCRFTRGFRFRIRVKGRLGMGSTSFVDGCGLDLGVAGY